ncbi:hypothetical protein F4779DRAFT_623916 [Xylariaceae sp. FL0662B]|nr:hypothetical protein F4779DRAFT_623916 [Xylariaceae sp. FL0662B]
MTAPSVPRIRANTPKVRTGCVSCKSRRIKCDEGHPTCFRCQKAKLPCKYDHPRSKQPDTRPVRDILPASKSRPRINNNSSRLLPELRSNNLNLRGSDIVYYDAFRNTIVDNLCLNGYTGFWSRTILRESMRDECVRDCVLGIGALYRAMKDDNNRQGKRPPSSLWVVPAAAVPALNRSHRDAIQYYTKSLTTFRSRISSEGPSTPPRTILIISILFIVFELMQGNMDSVDRIMLVSMTTLKDILISLHPELNPDSQIPTALDDEGVREAEYFLARLAGYSALCSPLYPSQLKSNAYQQSRPPKAVLPSWSSSAREIKLSFDRYSTSGLIWCMRGFQGTVMGCSSDPVRLQEDQATVNSQAQYWCEFMQEKLRQETDPVQARTWKSLLAQAKVYSVFTTYFEDKEKEELMWDSRLADCREAVDAFEAAMDGWTPTSNQSPLFEDQWLPSLRCLASRCRDYEVRTKALDLSERLTGSWWNDIATLIGLRIVVAIEEQSRDEHGHIPIKSRFRWSASSWNDDHTEFRVTLTGVITDVEKVFTIRQDEKLDCLAKQLDTSPAFAAALYSSEAGSPVRGQSLPIHDKAEESSPTSLPIIPFHTP